jgi:hypothetical protein
MRWSLTTRAADPAERLLRDNPVLLVAGPRTPGPIEALVRTWNPEAVRGEDGVLRVADGVSWHGPFRLDPGLAAETELPGGWSAAYVAEAARQRVRIPDGRKGDALRRRYPKDMPTGIEAVAWSLVSGLARRLDGAARLPGCAPRVAAPEETVYCVHGKEALSWQVLRSVVGLAIPDLGRNGILAPDDYCLDRPGLLEIKAEPFGEDEFLPFAVRQRAGENRPRTVYRFSALPQANDAETLKILARLSHAAALLAEVVGGVVVDGEGFPVDDGAGPAGS